MSQVGLTDERDHVTEDYESENDQKYEDSISEDSEEEEEEDEEALRRVREGFIVDSEEEEDDGIRKPKRQKKKRNTNTIDSDSGELSEEDLDLVIQNKAQERYGHVRRLKRRKQETLEEQLFSEEESEDDRVIRDEFDDFIEDDEPEENVPTARVRQPSKFPSRTKKTSNLDQDSIEQLYEIFGDGEEYSFALEEKEDTEEPIKDVNRLASIFEASELESKHLTDRDELIKLTDIPETYQLERPESDQPISINDEYEFVLQKLPLKSKFPMSLINDYIGILKTVLQFINVDNFEIPFIWHHRREYLETKQNDTNYQLLDLNDLWHILDLDLIYRSMKTRCKKLLDLKLDDKILDSVNNARDSVELNDLLEYIQFYSLNYCDYSNTRRGPKSRPIHHQYKDLPLYTVVKNFGIRPADFASDIRSNIKSTFTEDCDQSPSDCTKALGESETSIEIARDILAQEICVQPDFRKFLRHQILSKPSEILLTTNLTQSGKMQMSGESHPLYATKYIMKRPMNSFQSSPSLFLQILNAEDQGLIEIEFSYTNWSKLKQLVVEFLCSDNVSEVANLWNEQRVLLAERVFELADTYLMKVLKSEYKHDFEYQILTEIRNAFSKKLSMRGLDDAQRLMSVSSGTSSKYGAPITVVIVDDQGSCMDSKEFNSIESSDFNNFYAEHEPEYICLAGYNTNAIKIKRSLQDYLNSRSNDRTKILWIPDHVARIMQNVRGARTNLSTTAKYCVNLARYALDPLLEYISLGMDGILAISWHPHQDLINGDKLRRVLRSCLVDCVNSVGLDLNQAASSSEFAEMLQYIAGLGPRKAANIIKKINAKGDIKSRVELITQNIVGKTIFLNCSSFLHINQEIAGNDGDILDTTRIHNEDYDLARKMASDALDLDEEDLLEFEGDPSGVIVQLISQNAQDKLDDLILDDYAEQLQKQFNQKKHRILEQIRQELKDPMGERRGEFEELNEDELFTMLSGETDNTLYKGAIVSIHIKKTGSNFILGVLDSGIEVKVNAKHNVDREIASGNTCNGVILALNKHDFQAEADLRQKSIENAYTNTSKKVFWNWEAEKEEQLMLLRQESSTKNQQARVINHPLFKKFSAIQAESYLASFQTGDCVIRPSSRGDDHIVVTWKVFTDLYQHVCIKEVGKTNKFSLGSILRIGSFTYSDLDEVIALHIKPMARKVEEMMHHEKFQAGSVAVTDQVLQKYSEANPRRSIYAFCFNLERPGYFDLRFKTSLQNEIMVWPVKVIPNAFMLKGNLYPDMTSLCNGFKILFQNAQSQAANQSMQKHANFGYDYRAMPNDKGFDQSYYNMAPTHSVNRGYYGRHYNR